MKDDQNDIKDLITRFLAGEATSEEERRLSAWAALSEENRSELEKAKKIFSAATVHYQKSKTPAINVEEEWNIFLNKVEETKPVHKIQTYSSGAFWLRIAATILLIVASAAVIFYYSRPESVSVETLAATRTVTLPDGSTVVLNRNSTITYADDFGKSNRSLTLKGEAFFDVKRNESLPFVITARATTIQVLGTSFNVLAYDSLESVQVVVKTGRVRFAVEKLSKEIELTAGEKGVFAVDEASLEDKVNDDINFEAWNTHQLTFTESDLNSVIESISKAYNVRITITGPVSDSCVLTASFNNQSLEAVLNVLKDTLNLTYERVGNQIEITSAGC